MIRNIYSVSVVVGSSKCNAKCSFCGGVPHRGDANEEDSETYENEVGLRTALRLAKQHGAWAISLTGSGEPTVSPKQVSRVLQIVQEEGPFPMVQLFTNGIRIGYEPEFVSQLQDWKELGLTTICMSIHDFDSSCVYGVPTPNPKEIVQRVKEAGLYTRATLVLHNGHIDTKSKYAKMIEFLSDCGCDMVTSWCVVNTDGSACAATPSLLERIKIAFHLRLKPLVMGQVWGGGIVAYRTENGRAIPVRHTSYVTKHSPYRSYVRQLVVFQNGRVSYSWHQDGFDVMGSSGETRGLCTKKWG